MTNPKRYSVKRKYNKGHRFGKNKRGAGKGTFQTGNLKPASDLFPLSDKTRKVPTIMTTRITSLNFPDDESDFDKIKQGEELEAMAAADREAQTVEFDNLMEKADNLSVFDDVCPDGICRIMGGRKSRRRRRKGHKHRKSRKSRR